MLASLFIILLDVSKTIPLKVYYLTVNIYCLKDSAGVCHLKKLSNAGITHLHLLPTFQFAGVDDEKDNWKSVGKNFLKSYLG